MKNKIVLGIIVILGFVLRIYKVAELPAILNRDEAALAYNSYLLQETGQDEWGQKWPVALKSFGDYKLLGYPLLVIGSYSIFEVNDFAVRFPSVVAGTVLIVLAYFFAKEFKLKDEYALFFAFLISVTPVFFFYSRIAFEANVALSYFVASLYFIFRGKGRSYLIACFLMLLAVFTYNTPLLLLPFVIVLIPFIHEVRKPKKWLGMVVGLSIVFVIGSILLLSLSSQKSGITIFSDETVWRNSILYREQFSGIWQRVLGNKYLFYLEIILRNYWQSFSGWFLVTRGGSHPWHSLSSYGHIYGSVYVLSLIGLLSQIFNAKKNKKFLIIYLLFIALLPSAVTVDSPHATRSLLFFFLFSLMAVFGLQIVEKFALKKLKIKKQYVFAIVLGILFSQTTNYLRSYFYDYPQNQPESLNIGFKEIIQELEYKYTDQKIAIVDEAGFQYILTAWYLKIPPQEYRNSIIMQLPDKIGFHYGEQLGKYHFVVDAEDRNDDERIVVENNRGDWEVID